MKLLLVGLVGLLPVVLSEMTAFFWMHPPPESHAGPVLEITFPGAAWNVHPDDFDKANHQLRSTSGWIADSGQTPPELSLSFFRWDHASTGSTLEAFRHMPEQCMPSIGMVLEKHFNSRTLNTPEGTLVFDASRFRPKGGGSSVHIYKCVWVHGYQEADMRGGVFEGHNVKELRSLRQSAAQQRFRPAFTRVIMGSVTGMPTEDLAWQRFSSFLNPLIDWRRSADLTNPPS
ncbi:hypothetical protein [Haloferula sargassicola]|uniref:Methanolan biosynthesis EpsI domain-containing protein n=1 Tax=Haloferula sargassicola TaxID=490096 RepID=A0ABP9UW83_9BACT